MALGTGECGETLALLLLPFACSGSAFNPCRSFLLSGPNRSALVFVAPWAREASLPCSE